VYLILRAAVARLRSTAALALAALVALVALSSNVARAQTTAKPSIVLVHGAFADASSWDGVIPLLQKAGFTVYAPPNTLRGLDADATVLATFVNAIPGPVILVGHSYGGSVISVASVHEGNVKALVYVNAFAPDAGESAVSLLASYPPPPKDFFVPVPLAGSAGADLFIAPKYYGPVFASDVPPATAAIMAVTQRPITTGALNEKAPADEGWKTLPSWYVIGDGDLVIPPALQLMMATRAKSHISHVPGGSHPSMIEHPQATVDAILAAVAATIK
jgi:pimeloyl-ACP methyl ester carboxylesterase